MESVTWDRLRSPGAFTRGRHGHMNDEVLPDVGMVAARIRDELALKQPVLGVILGSGLGTIVPRMRQARSLPYDALPGFFQPLVQGHEGRLIAGSLGGRSVVVLSGRSHVYEGYDPAVSAFPVRVLHALGVPRLLVTNAAGSLRAYLPPGRLMVIRDQINLSWRNPLTGPVAEGADRFPEMSDPYEPSLRSLLHEAAASGGILLGEGVYCGVLGPGYETRAEVRMLMAMGGDAVGMSTVHEVIVARSLGMTVAGVSCITNYAAGLAEESAGHDEVLAAARSIGDSFRRLVTRFIRTLPTSSRSPAAP